MFTEERRRDSMDVERRKEGKKERQERQENMVNKENKEKAG